MWHAVTGSTARAASLDGHDGHEGLDSPRCANLGELRGRMGRHMSMRLSVSAGMMMVATLVTFVAPILMWRLQSRPSPGVSLPAYAAHTNSALWTMQRTLDDGLSRYKSEPMDTPTPTPTPICALSWSVVSSPNVAGSPTNYLFDVAAVSPGDVWVVGLYDSNNIGRTLTLHWDGTQWAQVISPNRGLYTNDLIDV